MVVEFHSLKSFCGTLCYANRNFLLSSLNIPCFTLVSLVMLSAWNAFSSSQSPSSPILAHSLRLVKTISILQNISLYNTPLEQIAPLFMTPLYLVCNFIIVPIIFYLVFIYFISSYQTMSFLKIQVIYYSCLYSQGPAHISFNICQICLEETSTGINISKHKKVQLPMSGKQLGNEKKRTSRFSNYFIYNFQNFDMFSLPLNRRIFFSLFSIQVFHCLKHEGTGGRTLLVDGFYAAEQVLQKAPEEFELLSKVPLKHEYIEDVGECHNHMIGVGPVLNIYPWNKELYLIR